MPPRPSFPEYRGRPLGSFGQLAAVSFHETKNVVSGEGGALLVNDPELVARAEIIREKGTNRSQFFRGEVDKYTWVDIGSSYLPSELMAAFLWAQLEQAQCHHADVASLYGIPTTTPLLSWKLETGSAAHRSQATACITATCTICCLRDLTHRTRVIASLKDAGVSTVFHYVPLHSAPAGRKFARTSGELSITDSVSDRLVRLPLWAGMDEGVATVTSRWSSVLEAVH